MKRALAVFAMEMLQLSVALSAIFLVGFVFGHVGVEKPMESAGFVGLAAMVGLILRDFCRRVARLYRLVSRKPRPLSITRWGE